MLLKHSNTLIDMLKCKSIFIKQKDLHVVEEAKKLWQS